MATDHADSTSQESLSPAERYDSLWTLEYQPPFLRAFLAKVGSMSLRELADVLRVDQMQRWRYGEDVLAEWYLDQYPRLTEDPEHVLMLLYGEVLSRIERGEQPTLASFLQRFPQYAELLALQWEVHHAVEAGNPGDTITTAAPRRDAIIGPTIPNYEIDGELGRGAVGIVYRARQMPLNRIVALKVVIEGQLARPEKLVRFLEEARSTARLKHPNIVGIHDFGSLPSGPYMALEWVPGGTLAERLKKGPMMPAPAANLLNIIAEAVGHAHTHNVVHRDLKPANILLTETGEPKVADFGLAKHLELGGGATLTGIPVGTALYMAPEQAAGRHRTIGPTADVYSLGAILYEMLTGRPPLSGGTIRETLRLVEETVPEPPRQLNPAIPVDLATIVSKCLEKNPQRRYASARELAVDLQAFREGRPVSARPVTEFERLWRWMKRKPTAALSIVLAILCAVLCCSTIYCFQMWITTEAKYLESAPRIMLPEAPETVSQSP
ncbi:MAG: serine/threonine-protein kinase [Gemmataceae bacterium]